MDVRFILGIWGGVPVDVSLWSVGLGVVILVIATRYINEQLPLEGNLSVTIAGLIATMLVGVSLVLHESAHAVIARLFGWHITGAGVSFWGAYVQLGDSFAGAPPLVEALTSFAGPATNLVIFALCFVYVALKGETLSENTVQYVAVTNYMLGCSNLLVLPFLDGGRVADGLLKFAGVSGDGLAMISMALYIVSFLYIIRYMRKPRAETMYGLIARV